MRQKNLDSEPNNPEIVVHESNNLSRQVQSYRDQPWNINRSGFDFDLEIQENDPTLFQMPQTGRTKTRQNATGASEAMSAKDATNLLLNKFIASSNQG